MNRPASARLGILYLIAGGLLFTVSSALIKAAGPDVPAGMTVFCRGLIGMLPVLLYLRRFGGFALLRSERPLAHLYRCTVGIASMYCGFVAVTLIPLADYVAINFAAPIFATALAVPLLGERVGFRRWAAVMVGCAGALLIVQPSGAGLERGAWLALAGAFGYGLVIVAMRDLGRTEDSGTTVFYFSMTTLVVGAIMLPFVYVPLSAAQWAMLAAMGITSGFGQLLFTEAYRHGDTAVIAPFDYVAMIWALLIGLVVFDQFPNALTLVGAVVVCLSGLYILYRETVRRAPPKPPVPPA
jgi:drug/metabolite transporter (DMT)-like permease